MSENATPSVPDRRRGRGRPSSSPELEARIIGLALAGNHFDVIANAAGVEPETLRTWLRSHRRRPFRERFEHAVAEAEARNVAIIANDASKHVTSAMWLLERRWPERWARASQRDKQEAVAAIKSDDPFAEVDELARRRGSGT